MSETPYDRAQFIYAPGGEVRAAAVTLELYRGAQRSGLLGRGSMHITQPYFQMAADDHADGRSEPVKTLKLEVFPWRHVDYPQAFALRFLNDADAETFLAWYPELALP
jgi:hypothetical protein